MQSIEGSQAAFSLVEMTGHKKPRSIEWGFLLPEINQG